jgi:hypothetical protein
MKRRIVSTLILGFVCWHAQAVTRVDINDPKALDAIQAADPARYEKLMGIIQLAGNVSCETLPQMLKVQYGAENVQCYGALIRTSYPAKRWLSFKLDDTAFSGNVVLTGTQPRAVPATQNIAR